MRYSFCMSSHAGGYETYVRDFCWHIMIIIFSHNETSQLINTIESMFVLFSSFAILFIFAAIFTTTQLNKRQWTLLWCFYVVFLLRSNIYINTNLWLMFNWQYDAVCVENSNTLCHDHNFSRVWRCETEKWFCA